MKSILPFIFTLFIMIVGLTSCDKMNHSIEQNEQDFEQHNDISEQDDDKSDNKNDNEEEIKNDTADYEPSTSINQMIHINDDNSITVLVNKYNRLSDHYIPIDLVTVSVPTVLDNAEINQMRQEAADALANMFSSAKKDGIQLFARSGYRSFETQVQLFNNYAERHGIEAANRYSAKPGHSEHQTGLVMDVTSESVQLQLTEDFAHTKEGIWLKEHAHKFGFIIRYPKDKEHITGYIYEPWHIRYLGIDVATAVYDSGLTYEEFLLKEDIIDALNYAKEEN